MSCSSHVKRARAAYLTTEIEKVGTSYVGRGLLLFVDIKFVVGGLTFYLYVCT